MSGANRSDLIPAAPIAEKFLKLQARGEITPGEVAISMGFKSHDSSLVLRRLGIKGYRAHDGRWVQQTHITYALAARIIRAMNLDPVDFDV